MKFKPCIIRAVMSCVTVAGLVASLVGVRLNAQNDDLVLTHFTFDGSGNDASGHSPPMVLANTEFIDGALFLNGIYPLGDPKGFVALASIPGLSFASFTFALDFKPIDLSAIEVNILSGGPLYRWMGLAVEYGELRLRISTKDLNWLFQFPEASVKAGEWHQVVCSVDASNGRIIVFFNGTLLREIVLPAGFEFNVVGLPVEESEKVFNFNNYGNASTFHGYVDNFRVYRRTLTAEEIAQIVHVNQDPRCHIVIGPQFAIAPMTTETAVLACDNRTGQVVLDASLSTDPQEQELTYLWLVDGHPVGADAILIQSMALGTHEVTLIVEDGNGGSSMCTASVTVITGCEAVEELMLLLEQSAVDLKLKWSLNQHLRIACQQIGKGKNRVGIRHLELFHDGVSKFDANNNKPKQPKPGKMASSKKPWIDHSTTVMLMSAAQEVIDALARCGCSKTN